MTEYEIGKSAGLCSACQQPLAPQSDFYSAVFERANGFERRDFCSACWAGPPSDSFCHFKARAPTREARPRVFIDDNALVEFFLRLGAHTDDPTKCDFRFVLALILMRKRILKYERTTRREGQETWELRLVRDGSTHVVLNPQLDDARMQLLSGELSAVLAGQEAELDGAPSGEAAESTHA